MSRSEIRLSTARGGTEHVVDEIRRAFDDAVGVVSVAWEDGAVLTGGGSVLAALSRDLANLCRNHRWARTDGH